MSMLSELPDNLRYKDGQLSTVDGQSVDDYLKSRWARPANAGAEPVVLVTRELFLRMAADHTAMERQRRAEEEERFPLAA